MVSDRQRFPWRAVLAGAILGLAFAATWIWADRALADGWQDVDTPRERMTPAEIREVAARYWPAREVDKAVRVALCESSGEWWSDHAGVDRRFGTYRLVGLWQIEATIWTEDAQRMAGPDMDLRDPRTNAAVAAFVWSRSGWHAWPVCGGR